MKYNFDEIIERRGTNSYKWDLVKEDGVIPTQIREIICAKVLKSEK